MLSGRSLSLSDSILSLVRQLRSLGGSSSSTTFLLLVGFPAGRVLARFLTGVVRSGRCLFSRCFLRHLRPGVLFHADKVMGPGYRV